MSGGGIPLVNVGDVLAGKYQVDRVLGIGGMGMVVAATHVELDQKVAIKFMLPTALANASATERFLREARAVVKLRSEHVCRVFDVGRLQDGAPYIVMELMDGLDLSQVLETRRILPVAEAVDLVMQALEGIAEAHANGIVHRDLKPANLFIASDSDGSPLVKVLDFGISKSSVGGSATKTGEIMGSPSYMAPEQMQSSKDVDVRADIWAIGVILYEATTGGLPFASENLPALCMQVMFDPVPPMQGVSPAFAAVVMRSLAKAASERYDDLGAFAMALAPYGTSDAAAGASRIVKVLRRTKGEAPATPWTARTVALRPEQGQDAHDSQVSPGPESAQPVTAAASAVRQSTLSGSASESLRVGAQNGDGVAELDGLDVSPRRPRWMLPAAFVGAAAVAVIAVVAVTSLSRSHGEPTLAPAAAPTVAPAPAPGVGTDTPSPAPAGSATAATPPTTAPVAPPPPTTRVSAPVTPPTPDVAETPKSPTSPTKKTSKTTTTSTAVSPPKATAVTAPPPPVTTAQPPPPATTTTPPPPETSPDGKPIYKGTKGKVITTYPTE